MLFLVIWTKKLQDGFKKQCKELQTDKKNWQKSPVLSKYTKYNKKICDLFYTLNWEKKP